MRYLDTAMAGGACPECGHNQKHDRVTVQKALPVLLAYLESTSVAGVLSHDETLGMAMEDQLRWSIERLSHNV